MTHTTALARAAPPHSRPHAEEIRALMDKKHNIRNMSVIAHVDHGARSRRGAGGGGALLLLCWGHAQGGMGWALLRVPTAPPPPAPTCLGAQASPR